MATLAAWNEEVYLSPARLYGLGRADGRLPPQRGLRRAGLLPGFGVRVRPSDQARLLASARRTLAGFVAGTQGAPTGCIPAERDTDLEQRSALFVTLHKEGELRGCIGTFAPRLPLWDAVADQTLQAAAEDPRFPAVSARDGPLGLEISLLTPLKRLVGLARLQARPWRRDRARRQVRDAAAAGRGRDALDQRADAREPGAQGGPARRRISRSSRPAVRLLRPGLFRRGPLARAASPAGKPDTPVRSRLVG